MNEKQVEVFYDSNADSYDKLRFSNPYHRRIAELEQRFVIERVKQGSSVLEIGPGSGRFTERLVEKAASVVAVDISAKMLENLSLKIHNRVLHTQKQSIYNLADLTGYGTFDTVVCIRVLPHLDKPIEALQAMRDSIRIGGNLLFDFWNCYSYPAIIRKLFRRPSLVYTRFYPYSQIIKMINHVGLKVNEELTWGYPRIGSVSLDYLGNKYFKPLGYSIIFNVTRK
jgi:2-polyprenyl-3-methyl-5-hydroxy-6-metoxy-1,4-benzoquinol methylase